MKLKRFLALLIAGYVCFLMIQTYFVSNTHKPILLWWTPFAPETRITECQSGYNCVVSGDRKYISDKQLKYVLFYGSNIDENDFPLPKGRTAWAIYHEESPKNLPIFLNKQVQDLFEITSTFSRFSTFPITLQYLKDLTELTTDKYQVSIEEKNKFLDELAPVLYIQTDCETPIERDKYVKELMKYIKVDSYGACLNNKHIPEKFKLNGTYELYENDFMHFVAKYKFIISIENAKCSDYITEKLWRSLIVGSIPIYLGSPTIKDWLPNKKSAILIQDFPSIKSVGDYINAINKDDDLYMQFFEHKRKQISNKLLLDTLSKGDYGIENGLDGHESTIPNFECFICEAVHRNATRKTNENNVYDCEKPSSLDEEINFWINTWEMGIKYGADLLSKI